MKRREMVTRQRSRADAVVGLMSQGVVSRLEHSSPPRRVSAMRLSMLMSGTVHSHVTYRYRIYHWEHGASKTAQPSWHSLLAIASCGERTCKRGFVTKMPDRIRRRRTMGSCQSMLLQSHHDFWLYACWSSVTVTKSFGGHWKISHRLKSNCIKHVAFWSHHRRQ